MATPTFSMLHAALPPTLRLSKARDSNISIKIKAIPRNAIIEDGKFYSCGFAETRFENFKKQPTHVQDEPREHSKFSNDDWRSRHDHLPSDLLCWSSLCSEHCCQTQTCTRNKHMTTTYIWTHHGLFSNSLPQGRKGLLLNTVLIHLFRSIHPNSPQLFKCVKSGHFGHILAMFMLAVHQH